MGMKRILIALAIAVTTTCSPPPAHATPSQWATMTCPPVTADPAASPRCTLTITSARAVRLDYLFAGEPLAYETTPIYGPSRRVPTYEPRPVVSQRAPGVKMLCAMKGKRAMCTLDFAPGTRDFDITLRVGSQLVGGAVGEGFE